MIHTPAHDLDGVAAEAMGVIARLDVHTVLVVKEAAVDRETCGNEPPMSGSAQDVVES